MLYKHIAHIVRAVKKHNGCPQCTKKYTNEMIDVVDIYEQEGFIVAYCPLCDVGVEITVTIQDEETFFQNNTITDYSKNYHVTEDDVQGVRNKLSTYKGELKDLFS